MSEQPSETPLALPRLKPILESAGVVVLSFVGLAYASGILIVNIRLASLGIPAPDLAESRYVLVGTLWFFLVTFSMVVVGVIRTAIKEGRARIERGQRTLGIVQVAVAPFGVLTIAMAVWVLTQFRIDFEYRETWFIVAVLLLTSWNARAVAKNILDLWEWLRGAQREREFVGFASTHAGLWETLALLVSVCLYALIAYPLLSPAFGGSRPTRMVLVVNAAATASIQAAGIKVGRDGRTQEVQLIFEDAASFFVSANNKPLSSIRLRKELVAAAVRIPDR
jgi:hypothetical protein